MEKSNIFTEFGIDFDNNKYVIGYSTEIEKSDGTEYRVFKFIPMENKSVYFRLWILKKVLVVSKQGVSLVKKNRHNFKCVFGISGFNSDFF